jgi:hypothetical protein
VRRDDEDDRAGGESWIDHVVIPDDISALDAEVRALHRERRARARRDRLRRLVSPRGIAGPLVLVVLLMVAGVASLLMLFQPRRPASAPAPLASPAGSGRNGGLLPDIPVTQADGTAKPLRDFRPAVLALAPIGCGCDAKLRDVGYVVTGNKVQFLLVDRRLPGQPVGLPEAGTVRLAEPTGRLAADYGADGRRTAGWPVLVLVGADGQVARVLERPTTPLIFDRELESLRLGRATTPSPTG